MSNMIQTVLFKDASPLADNKPVFSRANFSLYPTQQLIQVSTVNVPKIFVTSDYGSGSTQKDLADAYRAGSCVKNDLVLYVDPMNRGTPQALKFQEMYDEKATEYIASSQSISQKGKKRSVPLDGVSIYTVEGYIKMKVDNIVWNEFRDSIPAERRPDDILAFPNGDKVFVVFAITGVWHNATQYGQTIRVKRMHWKSAGQRAVIEKTITFIDEDDDEVSVDKVAAFPDALV